jgi:hypothetical protein
MQVTGQAECERVVMWSAISHIATEIFQGVLKQVDRYHPAAYAGLVGAFQHVDAIAKAKRPHGKNQQPHNMLGNTLQIAKKRPLPQPRNR